MKKLLILMAALALGCQQQPSSTTDNDPVVDPDPDPEERVAGISFAKSYDLARAGQFLQEFHILGQRDIIAAIDFQASDLPTPDGVHLVQFRVLNSQAAKHLTKWIAFTTDAGGPEKVPHPIGRGEIYVTKVSQRDGWLRIYSDIPVAGTAFTRHHLTGLFYAEAQLGAASDATVLTNTWEMLND